MNLEFSDLPGLARRMEARGMKLVPALGELHYNVEQRRNNWAYLEKASKGALEAAGDCPAILAWALCDEPRQELVGEMETFRRKFLEWGAKQPPVVVTMWPDSPVYAERAGFAAVCTDIYPFFSHGQPPTRPNTPAGSRAWYRRQTLATVQAARKAGRTPWIMPQCFAEIWGPWKYDEHLDAVMLPGAILHWRQPTEGEVRWQVWSAVGLGCAGVLLVCLPAAAGRPARREALRGLDVPAGAGGETGHLAWCSRRSAQARRLGHTRLSGCSRGVLGAEATSAASARRCGR